MLDGLLMCCRMVTSQALPALFKGRENYENSKQWKIEVDVKLLTGHIELCLQCRLPSETGFQ